jgi:hypothetical protein
MKRILYLFLFVLPLFVAACQQGQTPTPTTAAAVSKPNVVLVAPASNATFESGAEVRVQSTSADAQGIVLVELIVDGQTVQNSPTPNGQPQAQFSVIQTWTATTPGQHTITVKATNARLGTGEASITVNVTEKVAPATATLVVQPTPVIPTATPLAATATPAAPTTCTLASTFLSDVTIPDGTVVAPGGAFVKTWAIQNSGTCAWGGGYNVLFVDGEAFGASSPQPIPAAKPGDIINISINMTAPVTPGTHTSVWQLQASNGVPFGVRFDVVINVPGAPTPIPPTPVPPTPVPPPPAGCSGTPIFSSFIASPQTISPGQVSTLTWGPVSNASVVYLTMPSGTQGVGTPGSIQVQPSQTTTYTLTAYCNNVPAQIQVTVVVQGGGGACSGFPVFNGFYANPQNINAGEQTTLTWGLVQNASAVYLQLPNQTVGVGSPGTRTVKPSTTTTYTLVAYCGNNQASISTTVTVQGACSGKPNFNGFTANPSTIQKGQSSTLSWGLVTNATAVVLQTPNGSSGVPTPGQLVVTPNKTTTYTLIAYCKNTTAQLSVTVTVLGPSPTPTPTPTPSDQTEVRQVQVTKTGKGAWKVTIQYFWNGESSPAEMQAVGTNANGNPTTNVASRGILPGFVKYVILNLTTIGSGKTVNITACIVGKGNTELACKTVPAP